MTKNPYTPPIHEKILNSTSAAQSATYMMAKLWPSHKNPEDAASPHTHNYSLRMNRKDIRLLSSQWLCAITYNQPLRLSVMARALNYIYEPNGELNSSDIKKAVAITLNSRLIPCCFQDYNLIRRNIAKKFPCLYLPAVAPKSPTFGENPRLRTTEQKRALAKYYTQQGLSLFFFGYMLKDEKPYPLLMVTNRNDLSTRWHKRFIVDYPNKNLYPLSENHTQYDQNQDTVSHLLSEAINLPHDDYLPNQSKLMAYPEFCLRYLDDRETEQPIDLSEKQYEQALNAYINQMYPDEKSSFAKMHTDLRHSIQYFDQSKKFYEYTPKLPQPDITLQANSGDLPHIFCPSTVQTEYDLSEDVTPLSRRDILPLAPALREWLCNLPTISGQETINSGTIERVIRELFWMQKDLRDLEYELSLPQYLQNEELTAANRQKANMLRHRLQSFKTKEQLQNEHYLKTKNRTYTKEQLDAVFGNADES